MTPGRRAVVLGGAAVAAAIAGGWVGWRKFQPADVAPDALDAVWTMRFDSPAGTLLDMGSLRGRPLLINFWATWCPPCIEELPLLDSFYKKNREKKWQVVGLAIDQPSAVRNYLAKAPLSFPIGLAGLGGTELAKSMGNVTGGLPFTVVLGESGKILQRKMGRVVPEELAEWVRSS